MSDKIPISEAIRTALAKLGIDASASETSLQEAIRTLITNNAALENRITQLEAELAEARNLADQDVLCPVFNRRAFTREINREIALASRHGTSLSLLFLDLDHFKQVNDRLGHEAGDRVLKAFSRALIDSVRRTDIVGRLGGDEFGVLLIEAGQDAAKAQLARIGEHLSSCLKKDYAVSVSIGLATWKNEDSVDDLLAAADQAMFTAKSDKRL
ncbi:MAG: GGDEF domain-containing protein [Pseudomonadota bacterium]